MGSLNNWLGFSLTPQEVTHHHHHQHQHDQDHMNSQDSVVVSHQLASGHGGFCSTDEISPSDWNMKGMSMNSYSCSSHLNQRQENQETPKLENFLGVGGHSFTHDINTNQQNDKLQAINSGHDINNSYTMYQESVAEANTNNGSSGIMNGNSSAMGLSMIKNWLRNNPAPAPHAAAAGENKESADSEALPPVPPLGAAGTQCLSLSMSTNTAGSQQSDGKLQQRSADSQSVVVVGGAIESVPRKAIDTFGQRTSIYRGVTRHRWTGRYEAHLWDNSCRREGQTRKGRQVYLGGYDKEEKAARAYDLAALKYWGTTTTTNFPISNYEKEMEEMKHMTRQEYVASLRRKSSGFSRGASIYRGVTRHHQHGRWQARIGRVAGNKDLYLGTFSTQEEAAEAYDIAAIKFRGLNAVTNFEISRYDVKSILESTTLPIGGAAKRLKEAEINADNHIAAALELNRADQLGSLNLHSYGSNSSNHTGWPTIAFHHQQAAAQPLSMYPFAHQRLWCKQEQLDTGFEDNIQHHQLGNSTHNFLQPSSVLHNLMSLDSSSSMQHEPGSNYGNNGGGGDHGNGFVMPMVAGTMNITAQDDGNNSFAGNDEENINKPLGYEGMFGSSVSSDNGNYQQARNLYYQQLASSDGITKAGNLYDQGSMTACNTNWMNIPTAVPTLAARPNHLAVCPGASTFTVWNDT